MTNGHRILGIVLAGGAGKRLAPLTADRAKPAVPFGRLYRLVDFALSNLVNSSIRRIAVLTQYKSHSLDRHLSTTWRLATMLGDYVTPVPAQQRIGPHWQAGSADAIFQSLNLIDDERPDVVAVFGADHVYRMDPRQMLAAHQAWGAGVTVAGVPVPRAPAPQAGVPVTLLADRVVLAVDSGGGGGFGFTGDQEVTNGTEFPPANAPAPADIDTSGVPGAPAEAIYQTARVGDVTDAALLLVYEGRWRSAEHHEAKWVAHQAGKVERALHGLESDPPVLGGAPHVGQIALACALGYQDLRFDGRWRAGHPRLTTRPTGQRPTRSCSGP